MGSPLLLSCLFCFFGQSWLFYMHSLYCFCFNELFFACLSKKLNKVLHQIITCLALNRIFFMPSCYMNHVYLASIILQEMLFFVKTWPFHLFHSTFETIPSLDIYGGHIQIQASICWLHLSLFLVSPPWIFYLDSHASIGSPGDRDSAC